MAAEDAAGDTPATIDGHGTGAAAGDTVLDTQLALHAL
jgi:hypothetical protein